MIALDLHVTTVDPLVIPAEKQLGRVLGLSFGLGSGPPRHEPIHVPTVAPREDQLR